MSETGVQISSAVLIFDACGLFQQGAIADLSPGHQGILDFLVRARSGSILNEPSITIPRHVATHGLRYLVFPTQTGLDVCEQALQEALMTWVVTKGEKVRIKKKMVNLIINYREEGLVCF